MLNLKRYLIFFVGLVLCVSAAYSMTFKVKIINDSNSTIFVNVSDVHHVKKTQQLNALKLESKSSTKEFNIESSDSIFKKTANEFLLSFYQLSLKERLIYIGSFHFKCIVDPDSLGKFCTNKSTVSKVASSALGPKLIVSKDRKSYQVIINNLVN